MRGQTGLIVIIFFKYSLKIQFFINIDIWYVFGKLRAWILKKKWHTYKALNTTEKNKNSKNEKVTSKNFYLSGNWKYLEHFFRGNV